ncbi:hypothetical protein AA313_de0206112 [Arthrobotrys entomopaga]|nr:hypothetical protein AA313_de0206112 [Arthrobotrys entomopaga]
MVVKERRTDTNELNILKNERARKSAMRGQDLKMCKTNNQGRYKPKLVNAVQILFSALICRQLLSFQLLMRNDGRWVQGHPPYQSATDVPLFAGCTCCSSPV